MCKELLSIAIFCYNVWPEARGQKLVARAARILEVLAPRWTQHKRHLRACRLALPALPRNPGEVVYKQGRSRIAEHTGLLEVHLSPP